MYVSYHSLIPPSTVTNSPLMYTLMPSRTTSPALGAVEGALMSISTNMTPPLSVMLTMSNVVLVTI